jgi:hypothetical protein
MKDIVIVATMNVEKALYVIAKSATNYDEIELQFVDKYAPTVEYVLRILRRGFGWYETDRRTTIVKNVRCANNQMGLCKHPKNVAASIHCKEQVRSNCKEYIPLSSNSFEANVVMLEKAGGIRGVE